MDEGNEQAIQNLGLFNSFTLSYKTVNNHEITTDILIPKNIKPGKHPLLVRFHGGGLVTGTSSFIGFFPAWVSEYAHAKSAVIVSPNYRLLPEARGADILEDISDFWAWVTGGKLQVFVESCEEAKGVVIDLEKIWAHGESAGGYLSIQSGLLLQPGTLRIISAAYPMLDWHDPWYTTPHTAPSPTSKPFFNAPLFPRSLLTSHLQSLAPGSTISAADPPERIDLMLSIGQQARWAEFLGTEDKLYPMQEIEKRDEFPPVFIFHGKDDSAIPAVGTERFVDVYKRRFGAEKILCRIEEGDHGFDKPSKLEDEWLVQGLGFVEREWLG